MKRRYDLDQMKPLAEVHGDSEAARMDAAVRRLFAASGTEFQERETKRKPAKERKQAKKGKP